MPREKEKKKENSGTKKVRKATPDELKIEIEKEPSRWAHIVFSAAKMAQWSPSF
jgi:hypothetical protein